MKTLVILSAAIALAIVQPAGATGAELFSKKCGKCHGADGKGDTPMGKKLKIEDLTAKAGKLTDEQISKSVTDGVTVDGKVKMKKVEGLSDEELKAVVEFVKSLKS